MLKKSTKSLRQVMWNGFHISISNFIFGYAVGVFNSCQDNVSYSMGWSSTEKKLYVSLFSTFIPIGALFGSIFTAYLSNTLGRPKTVMILDILTVIGSFLSIFSNTAVFGIGRFICGVSCGICLAISPVYISEMTPAALMGTIGPIMALMLSIGLTMAFSLSLVLPTDDFSQSLNDFWRFMFVVPGIVASYQCLFFLTKMKLDTPAFYFRSQNYEKYKKVLMTIFYEKDIPTEEEFRHDVSESLQFQSDSSYKNLICDKTKSKMLRIGVILAVFQQFSGINAVLFYSFSIYQEIGLSVMEARIFTVCIGLTYMLSSIFTILILKYVGRKASLLYGHSLVCAILVLMGLISQFASHLSYFLAVLLVLYIGLFNFGLSATLWSYIGEIQTERAVSISVTFNYLSNIVINYSFPISLRVINIYYIFYFFGLCMLFASIYIKYDTIETNNTQDTKSQIQPKKESESLANHEFEVFNLETHK